MDKHFNKFQLEALTECALEIENKLREEGYMSLEICFIAQKIIENNLHGAKEYIAMESNSVEILQKAEEILKELKNL